MSFYASHLRTRALPVCGVPVMGDGITSIVPARWGPKRTAVPRYGDDPILSMSKIWQKFRRASKEPYACSSLITSLEKLSVRCRI
jgi:hypothetical protein